MRKTLKWVTGLLSILVLILTYNVWRFHAPPLPSLKLQLIDADARQTALKLSKAVQIATVADTDGLADKRHAFMTLLQQEFPLVHARLQRTEINQFALLYTWAGSDPKRKPLLLMAHYDVVPAQGEWTHAPFSGELAQGFVWGRGD